MPRHHAALVHHQLSSYLKTGLIKSPPPSYSALLNYPPTPTPLRQSIKRDEFDLPTSLRSSSSSSKRRNSKSTHKFKKLIKTCKPLPIEYSELDQLRKAFFKDHPFEAYRPMNLIENPNELLYKTLKEPVRRIQSNGTLTNESDLVGVENWIELRQRTRVPRSEE
ncbi:mitochondrial ribosomal protein S25-domain-containing protein [Melampsora americana]|nr:mitochondrial ribosomal protein S25-domain-containing protein [Melampsora americana]